MTTESFERGMAQFCKAFVHSVIAWNSAEEAARRILESVAEGGLGTIAAITHLGSRGLNDAILTVADFWDDPQTPNLQESASHIKHFLEGLDRLRGYRNFYVHSLYSVGQKNQKDGPFVGVLSATEARGRYAWVQQEVTDAELVAFMQNCYALKNYGQAIAAYLKKDNALSKIIDYQPKRPLSLLEKPQWPEQLKKNRSYLLKQPSPPPA